MVPSAIVVDENPWCFQCSEAHWEHECPCNSVGHQQVNNIDYLMKGPQINIAAEEHQEAIKEAVRSARMAVINKLDQESKDKPITKEENSSQIEWPTKEEYQQLINDLKAQKLETVKILKKVENDVQIHPSQQKIFVAESHPPPSTQYTRVIQGTTNFRVKEYKKGDMVGRWDANKGRPNNITEDNHVGFGPSRVRNKSMNDSYYFSTIEGRRPPLPISGRLLKPHQGGGT